MTFPELRNTIAAEMPPGWGWKLAEEWLFPIGTAPILSLTFEVWTCADFHIARIEYLSAYSTELMLDRWRELKGELA